LISCNQKYIFFIFILSFKYRYFLTVFIIIYDQTAVKEKKLLHNKYRGAQRAINQFVN